MFSRLPGALLRALLMVWVIATPALLLSDVSADATQIVALMAVFAGLITLIEYASHYPSLVEFRHAPPFNRIRFAVLFSTVFVLTIICRGKTDPTTLTEFFTAIGTLIGHSIDFPYSPVRNVVLMMPADADPVLVDAVRTAAGLAYFCSLVGLTVFLAVLRLERWPARGARFNVWVNLPTFDPTAGGDVVGRLQRDARVNVMLGFLLPFVIPAVAKAAQTLDPDALSHPQTLIWTMTAWAFLPASLFMRGIAMGRVAQMIEETRRRRYAEVDEDGALA
ncbi:MAG: hypothetical protein ACU0CO_06885 [Shimia sp.]